VLLLLDGFGQMGKFSNGRTTGVAGMMVKYFRLLRLSFFSDFL
jgi:hypothetical protein